jgi:hypothetical protein
MFERISDLLNDIKANYKDKTVLIATHSGVCRVLYYYFNGIPESGSLLEYQSTNCSLEKYEEALESCEKANKFKPDDREIIGCLTSVLISLGKINQSLETLSSTEKTIDVDVGADDAEKIKSLQRAINGGYFDIQECRV